MAGLASVYNFPRIENAFRMTSPNTYRAAGVDVAAADGLLARIHPALQAGEAALSARGSALLSAHGGYAALVRAPAMQSAALAACADGIGTKAALLAEHDKPHTAGIDVVAMCVNDLLCAGAQPLFFLDYYACDKLAPDFAARVIEGVAEGCAMAGCALVGGETAEMPGFYGGDKFDLAGFAVGIADADELARAPAPQPGDAIIAIAAAGPHSNGYSLIRRVIAESPPPSAMLEAMLAPTRIYCQSIAALRRAAPVHGLAHITGGGIPGNLPRILPEGLAARVDMRARSRPAVFDWIQDAGQIEETEMRRVFNCGIGMLAIVAQEDASAAMRTLGESGETCWIAGEVVREEAGTARVIFPENEGGKAS